MLPKVTIKDAYKNTSVPQPSAFGGRTQKWPIDMEGFAINIPNFNLYLAQERNLNPSSQEDCLRALSRTFHMLHVDGLSLHDSEDAADPVVMVALYIFGVHIELLSLPLLAPAYTWTRRILIALKTFCDWQQIQVNKQLLMSDDLHWQKYASSLNQLSVELNGGLQKKVTIDRKKRQFERRLGDANKLEGFPPVHCMKDAVFKAMKTLHYIKQNHQGVNELPHAVQSTANAALVGILWLNGFGGRKMEWETMLREHCKEQINKGLDYFCCQVHKTSNTYGSLAKWIAPGTLEAIKVYMDLPCRPGVQTLFVPVNESTDHMDIPKTFGKFCKAFLPKECSKPTVNLMRKWYHTELHKLSQSEDKLLGLFKSIDAHSTTVAKQHYVLQTPAYDAKLAKALVHSMIGKPVMWPSDAELADLDSNSATYLELVRTMLEPICDVADEEDASDKELVWWEVATTFGRPQHLPMLEDAGLVEEPAQNAQIMEHSDVSGMDYNAANLQPPAKRGRQSSFTEVQQVWIASKAKAWGGPVPNIAIKEFLKEGIDTGILPDTTTQDQVRHVCRMAWV
jgi:hypothetical protein